METLGKYQTEHRNDVYSDRNFHFTGCPVCTCIKGKHVGYDYLHNHKEMEKKLNVPFDHVIVDKKDWEEVIMFFHKYPENIKLLKMKTNIANEYNGYI